MTATARTRGPGRAVAVAVAVAFAVMGTPRSAHARLEPPAAEPMAVPAPELEPELVPEPEPAAPHPNMGTVGIGLVIGGGVIAVGGLGLTIAYTVVGDQQQAVEAPIQAKVDQANRISQAGGALLASGLALVAVGGVLFTRSRARPRSTAGVVHRGHRGHRGHHVHGRQRVTVHVTPAWGGLVVSGRF